MFLQLFFLLSPHGACTNMDCIRNFYAFKFLVDAEAEARTMTSPHATLQKYE
jgi:hypothetical protein